MLVPYDAETLFRTFFWPLYPTDVQEHLAEARRSDANPGNNPLFVRHLQEAATMFVHNGHELLGKDCELDFSDASIHRISAALSPERIAQWASYGTAGTAESTLFNGVVHGAAYLGQCIALNHGGEWTVRRPLWESMVRLQSQAGEGDLPVFHWWLKSMSSARSEGEQVLTLADRYRTHVEIPCSPVNTLPAFLKTARSLSRLSKVTYSGLYKYIKANLPELRDLGADFPSAERFDAYAFRWLDFVLLGGGRMVLIHGANDKGHHLFWLDHAGFQKSAFYPCDTSPDPKVNLDDPTLTLTMSTSGRVVNHQLLWWGP